MEELSSWSELFFGSLNNLGRTFMGILPSLIGAIVILVIGWLFAKIVSGIVSRLLRLVKFDLLIQKVKADEFLQKANIKIPASTLVGKFVYWTLILLVIITVSDILGWKAVSDGISNLLAYLPKLLVAIVFFIVGSFIASFVRDFIRSATQSLGIGTGKLISSLVYYILFIIVALTSLEQGGIDTTIITSNLLLIMGAILGAAAISYGIASKDLLANLLAGFFSRKTFQVGQVIEVDGASGKIIELSNISVTLQSAKDQRIVVPIQELITNKVRIIG